MKSIIIKNNDVHRKLKILSAQTGINISDLIEESILDIVKKYQDIKNETM